MNKRSRVVGHTRVTSASGKKTNDAKLWTRIISYNGSLRRWSNMADRCDCNLAQGTSFVCPTYVDRLNGARKA